jgi:hypothetical protein
MLVLLLLLKMSVETFVVYDRMNNIKFGDVFLNKTFLCMENVKNKEDINRQLSFDCKQYNTIDTAINKLIEEKENIENTKRRMTIVQIPEIVPDILTNQAINRALKRKYWGQITQI